MSSKLVIGNWKMNGRHAANLALLGQMLENADINRDGVGLAAPAVYLAQLASVLQGAQTAPVVNSALIEPELNRRKQPLEAYPLDTMSMVGSLNKQGQLVALVKVDNLLYQVRAGSYLGQNYGKVTRITETEVTLREIVQDAAGEWIERPAALQLLEEASK